MSYLKEKQNLRYLFHAFIPCFHNEKKKMSMIFTGGMIIIVKLITKTPFMYTAGLVSRIKKPGFSANWEFFPSLAMSTDR